MGFLIIADDLSGAADCAAGFARAGLRGAVVLDAGRAARSDASEAEALTVDTDSRRASAAEAARRAHEALAGLGQGRRVVKKIDSTLRGNWAAEVAALQRTLGLALVAPAFPEAGRVVRGGRVLVHGVALSETDTWQLEHAGRDDRPVEMLAAAGLKVRHLGADVLQPGGALGQALRAARAEGCQALVFDADSQAQLQALACQSLELPDLFWVGSAGLSRALASALAARHPGAAAPSAGGAPAGAGPAVLTIVGSLSAVSARQVRFMGDQPGIRVHTVPPALLRQAAAGTAPAGLRQFVLGTEQDLRQGMDVVVAIGADDGLDPAEGPLLARALAQALRAQMLEAGGLVLTGGETARAMLESLGAGLLHIQAESEPGVVLSVCRDSGRPRVVATKAGAFGHEQSLSNAYRAVKALLAP